MQRPDAAARYYNFAKLVPQFFQNIDLERQISPESGDMNVPQMITSVLRHRRLGGTLAMGLMLLIPGRAATPTLTSLYSFTGGSDGAFPEARLVLSSTGILYGTTYSGGASGWGTVFQLAPPSVSGGPWSQRVLYSFTGGNDGANPLGSVIIGKNSVLYGTTFQGGSKGYGTVFQLTPATGGVWTEKTLYTFTGGNDGGSPQAGLAISSIGVLYGTTYFGGTSGQGTVFQLTQSGGVWTEKVLYNFLGGNDGANPQAPLALSTTGVLYGTTYTGGSAGWGTVFSLTPGTGGSWTESVLYTFTGAADGGSPQAGITLASNGVLYGSTFWGGNVTACPLGGYPQGCGTVFQLANSGGTWTETVLLTFQGPTKDGSHPFQNLFLTAGGALWGTTFSGSSSDDVCFPASYTGCGMVFQLKPPATSGNPWTENIMHSFLGDDGGGPTGVVLNKSGIAYGATYVGGTAGGYGTVFQVTP